MSSCEPRPPIEVNYAHAEAMTVEDLTEPIVLLHVGENEGIVSLREEESEAHYVVGDGNHRLLAANRMNTAIKAYVLSQTDSAKYEC